MEPVPERKIVFKSCSYSWFKNLQCRVNVYKALLFCATTDCPGTQSEKAGKAEPCKGCPNQSICSSGKASIPDPGEILIGRK